MSYECSDFTDDVFNAFVEYGLISENDADDADDDPSRQASLVLRALDDLIEEHGNLIVALKELLKWADKMGGWDAKCWKYAQNLVTRIEKKQPLSMGCCEVRKAQSGGVDTSDEDEDREGCTQGLQGVQGCHGTQN